VVLIGRHGAMNPAGRLRCDMLDLSVPMAQPFGGLEHLLARLPALSNLLLEIKGSRRAYVEVHVLREGTLRSGGCVLRQGLLSPSQAAELAWTSLGAA
jgi:hypothetical protein